MFTVPPSGSGNILVARPSASSGTITNAANAYDLPSSRPDDPPYSTSADRALVSGSAVAGTPDYVVVEYNTFPSKSKSNFSQCQLSVGVSAVLTSVAVTDVGNFVTPGFRVDYQIDGSTWVTMKSYIEANNSSKAGAGPTFPIVGSVDVLTVTKETLAVTIPASSFPSNLNSLKVRFRLGTCTNNVTGSQSNGSYQVWDIRANIS